ERWMGEARSSFAAMEQLLNTPVFAHHGDADAVVDVAFTRHAVERLQRWGYDVRYREHPGMGHEDLGQADEVTRWLLSHRLAEAPAQVRIRAPSLDDAHAWWMRVTSSHLPLTVIEADSRFVA